MSGPELWFREIYRVPVGSESMNEPVAGWWIECTRYGAGWVWGMEPAERRWFGPFETMQEAADFRDGRLVLH